MDVLTFEELERQVELLPAQQQFHLLARISEKLSRLAFDVVPAKNGAAESAQHEAIASVGQTQFNDWLAECDRIADLWEGPFDSAADLRRLRNEE